MEYKDYKLIGIDLAKGGDYISFGDTIVQNKPKCLNCGRKLKGGTPENLRNVNRWRIRLKNNSEVTKKEYELFYTREQAEEALKKAEGK